jgi:thiol:disulfide interchange protein
MNKTLMALFTLLTMVAGAFAAGREIYPPPQRAAADIAAALSLAATEHRRVIIDFGGNWCPDCQVLDTYFHDATNERLLDAYYVLVHVNVGLEHIDQNFDVARHYGIPLEKGVPALAVLNPKGELLHSQKAGEFESMRHMESSAVTRFLTRWKPAKPAGKTA